MAEGDPVTKKASDVGVPMVEGRDDEPTGPEDAAGIGVKRGDYSDRGDGQAHTQMVRDADGDIVAQDQVALMEATPGVPGEGEKGGVDSATGGGALGYQNTKQTVAITGTPTGGTFTLTDHEGNTTAAIAYNAAATAVRDALLLLDTFDTGDVTASGGALPGTPVVLELTGDYEGQDVDEFTADDALLTGGTAPAVTVTKTQSGGVGEG